MVSRQAFDAQKVTALLSTIGLDSASTQTIVEAAQKTRSLTIAISNVQLSPSVTPEAKRKLNGLQFLDDFTNGDIDLVSIIWKYDMPQTVHDLAMHYAGLMTIQEPPNTETLRRKVYTEDPTAVLKSLFQANILPVDDIDKAQILSIFDHGEKKNYNIKTDSINTILDDPTLQLTNAAKQYMQRIQRLSLLVEMPEDLKYLLKTPLISAHDISNTPKDTFILSMTTLGLSSKSAVRIYNHALTVESRNEHLWASLQSAQNPIPAAIRPASVSRLKSAMPAMASSLTAAVITGGETDSSVPVLRGTTLAGSTTAVKPQINYESLFGLIDTNNCDDCDSVNSPAAYFVDLLRFLKNSPSDPTNLKSDSVLTKLFARRPDLQKLQLSCPNTNVLIPYIDLINEVLESYIKSAASGASPINIQAFNMGDDDTSNDRIEHAYGTDYDTYQNIILPQAFPLSIFPYNQAVDSTRAFLSALGSSRSELISVFQAPFLLQSTYSQTSSDAILDLSKASLKNAVSAEALGLQPQDYVAITGSGIFPEAFFNAIGFFTSNPGKTYTGVIGLLGPAQYWGYASNESMVSEAVDGLGLSFVQNQLLPRASITFQELLDILKTEFLNKTLALENSNGGPELSSDVSDLRLRHNMPGKYNSPLTADDCNLLQSFIRLMRKTGLSVFDLDAVLSCFAQGKITSDTINNLATVKRISEKTGIDITSLLPLWGIIDTNGEKSLYARVFLRAGLKSEDSVFDADANGQYLAQNAKISEHISSILSALKLSADQFSVLRTAGNITDDALTLQNLSNLYRMVLLCKVLGINSLDYAIFKTIIGVGIDPFKDPNKTMDLIENWESLTTAGFSLSSIRFVTGNGMDSQKMYGPSAAAALQAGGNIITGLKKISSDYATYDPSNPSSRDLATSAEVSKTSAVLFDPSTAATVTALIERTIPLDEYAKIFYQEVLHQYISDDATAQEQFFGPVTTTGSKEDIAIANEEALITRRLFYLNSILPTLKFRLSQQIIIISIQGALPDLEATVLKSLLTQIIQVGTLPTTALVALNALNQEDINITSGFDGYFAPPTTDSYRFSVAIADSAEMPQFYLAGVSVAFDKTGTTWSSKEIKLTLGQYQHLAYAGNLSKIFFTTARTPLIAFTANLLITQNSISTVGNILQKMSRFSSVASTFGLELSEVMYFQSLNSSISVDFNNISYSNIVNLSKYTNLRATFSAAAFTLIDFLKWTSRPDRVGTLPEKLAALISWPEHQVKAYITSKFPVMEDVKVVQLFQNDWNELLGMKIVIDFVNKISLDEVQLKSIFTWALPVLDPSTGQDFKIAAALRQAVKPPEDSSNINDAVITKANNTLRNNQRTALIGYLLQQKYIQDRGLIDADSLFDFFLIDVQMGTCLQTSRIKQAISTVQLFVQRCILALEKDSGISSTAVNQDRWSWMQKYRLWDANRKVFLYPENYLEPTLRDDKTELFKTLESSILQTDLNSNTIADQIKAYIYAANTIADLETVSYIWDKGENYQGKFHFFARTRTSPYIYYYRTMEITGQDFVKVFWQPWSKMDVDIPVQEVDSDGKKLAVPGCYLSPVLFRNRVFLFIPQLTLKSLPNAGVGKKSATQVGNEPVNDNAPQKYWEVQIGWTEFRNGKWSPKEVSQATLSVGEVSRISLGLPETGDISTQLKANSSYAKLMQLPGIGDFKFWVRERQNAYDPAAPGIVVVDIERQVGPLANNFTINGTSVSISKDSPYISIPLGRFEMRGPKLMLANPAPGDVYMKPGGYTVPTTFQKYSWSYNRSKLEPPAPSAIGVTRGNETEQPLLGYALDAKPPDSKAVVTATWALAFDELNSTVLGFVQDRSTSETNRSYFHYPPINYDALVSSQNPNKFASASFPTDQFQHVLSPALMEVATVFDGLDDIYRQLAKTKDADISSAFGGRNGKPYHELANPYSIYNWEVGVHAVMLLMERLLATQQFDLAIQVARYVFDPTANGASLDRCWLFPPFKDPSITKGTSINDILSGLTPSPGSESSMSTALVEWRNHPFMAHSIARGRPVAYMKRIVMKYIEILIASGDEYFRQNSLESLPLAIQRYVEASHIFGPAPKLIPKLGRKKYKTYSDLEAQLNDFSNAAADLELSFPFLADPAGRGAGGGAAITGIMKSTYFCIPANPNLIALRNLIDDRLFKIRHCQDINGNARSLALFDPPIDPLLLTRAQANGLSLSSILNDLDTPMPNYRFFYLLQKALELCGELKSLGALFLAAKEKKDSEALSALRARQDTAIQNLILDYKQLQKKEAQATIDSLQETRLGQVTRLSYFLQLAGETAKEIPGADSGWDDIQQVIEKPTDDDLRMSSNEKLELDKADEAAKLNMDATVLDISTSIIAALPDIDANTMPLGCGVTVGAITANIAKAMGLASEVLRGFATDSSNQSARASRKAQLIRQLQDRRLQANIAGRDIKVTDKQIATQQVRVDMCNSDIKTQQKQIADAIEMEKYLKSKYTSEALYSWMDSSVRSLFYQTYTLASDLAMKAQRAYQFERPSNGTSFINTGYWDNSRDGMLSAENLYLNLKRMESSYLENRAYDFEIVKNISLRQLRPWALIQLRETGVAEFDIPEVMFDFDFPGQYCRRIKSVSLSVPCIVGPYTGVNMTLSLVKHQYRVQGVSSNSKYEQSGDDDPRFRTDRTPITSIAVSHGQQDSGVFQLNFQDERYIPFEGAGAISTWRVELPTTVKQFDYESISDVILHMRYTAVNGSMALKRAASTYVTNFQKATENIGLTNGISAVFDLKNDFPNEWYNLTRSGADGASVNVTMATLINRLPFWTKGRNVRAKGASVAIAPTAGAATVDWSKELTMAVDSNNIALKKGVDVGSCKVLMTATDLDLPLKGDWKVTLSPMAKKSVPERIFLVVLYIVSG